MKKVPLLQSDCAGLADSRKLTGYGTKDASTKVRLGGAGFSGFGSDVK